MFEFNKDKRMIEGPVEFTFHIEIDRPASDVFPLVDIADARFRHAQMGAKVVPNQGSQTNYELTMEGMDDVVFRFTLLERVEGSKIKMEAVIEPQINALVKSVETQVIEPISDTACRVTSTTLATFDAELSDEDIVAESAVMNEAVIGDLEKLKVLAEDGLEAVHAMEEADMTFDLDFDLGDLDIDWDDIEPEQ